ncbi:hypothetical protein GGR50DRAFT_181288 [Xylaria sp. CBS 124048]|nr:hypothetical protein GGR50DRAFT_181288 [Xylaria sp. CBS 124048]
MCQGSKIRMACGHVEAYVSRPCRLDCSTLQGPTQKLNRLCPRCEVASAQQARRDELKALLLAGEQPVSAQLNTPSSHSSRTHDNVWGAPWQANTNEPDEELYYLTDDGTHVIQKKYVTINGHEAMITCRRELREIDAALLSKLREVRDKKLAKERAREMRRALNEDDLKKMPISPFLEERLQEARERFRKETDGTSASRPIPPQGTIYRQPTVSNEPQEAAEMLRKQTVEPPTPPSTALPSRAASSRQPTASDKPQEARERLRKRGDEAYTLPSTPPPSRDTRYRPVMSSDQYPGPISPRSGRPPLRRMKRGAQVERMVDIPDETESLDLWQTLADEYDEHDEHDDRNLTPRSAKSPIVK